MKKHLSVFMLMARSTIYKVIGLFVVMAAVGWSLVYSRLKQGATGDSFNLELVIEESRISLVFAIAFVLITILLSRTGCEFSSKLGYTLKRLSISERWIFFWQSLYNMMCYLMFWMVQVLVVFWFCSLYVKMAPEGYVTNQTIFLAFYRSDFLHSLLPMENVIFWVKNIIAVIAMGICSAYLPIVQRRGGKKVEVVLWISTTAAFFVGELGEYLNPVMAIISALIGIGVVIFRLFAKEDEGYEEMEANQS